MKKVFTLCLAMMMTVSLLTPAHAAAVPGEVTPQPVCDYPIVDIDPAEWGYVTGMPPLPSSEVLSEDEAIIEIELPELPITDTYNRIRPEDIVIEVRNGMPWLHVFVEDQGVVTMSEQFLLDYATEEPVLSWKISTNGGYYVSFARSIVDELFDYGLVTRAFDGSLCYNQRIIHVDATGKGMPIPELISQYLGVPVMVQTMGTIDLEVIYADGMMSLNCMTIDRYELDNVEEVIEQHVAHEPCGAQMMCDVIA